MKKILLLLFSFSLFSCFDEEQEKKDVVEKNQYLNQNSVTVVIPISLWNGKIGEKIREKFAAPITGLHECESVFTLMPIHTNYLPSDAKASRNILIVSSNFKNQTTLVKNKFANNQNVFTIQGKNEDMLLNQLQNSGKEIMNTFYNSEINLVLQKINVNSNLKKQVAKQFSVDIQIPSEYKKGLQGENFLWLRKEVGSGFNNMLIYTASFSALYNQKALVTNSMFMRNQVAKKYVLGKTNGSYMITEQAYYPSFHTTEIQKNLAYEMRGNWEFHNDFMTGPYVNFAIRDNKRKRFIIIDGFAYNPVHSKKNLLFEMEAIIKSTKIL
ncbi:DUF4837 family protein [Flavobacterium terrigena]|uniref:DUF4837 domain-containing protein n=1 Tax=Flavobacterium terrigena TaxID=402734 RepID=A0A1H6TBW5_9FLAO|nr:DUF4837 family protein [Flavobacterium terrigena]SEI77583.1 protein of unknown function [Flavobacterium terrigena]